MMAAQESIKESIPSGSVAISRIPVLMGIFQDYKEKSNLTNGNYGSLLTELKEDLNHSEFHDFDRLIDQISTKFELFFDDEDLPDRIKDQIARLQFYIFVSSIQENNLLKRSSNPARRLLDTIIRIEVDFAIDNQEEMSGHEYLQQEIDLIYNKPFVESDTYSKLLEGYIEHTSEKSTASPKKKEAEKSKADVQPIKPEVELQQVAKPEIKPVEAIEEPEEPEEDITESVVEAVVKTISEPASVEANPPASENIYPVIQSMVNDMTLPLRVQGRSLILFDEVWSPLLLEIALTKGFKSAAWQKILTIAKTQVWVLTPKSSKQELDKLLSTTRQIEKSLSQSMQSLEISADQQASLLEFLEHEQADIIAQSKATIESLKKSSSGEKSRPKKDATKEDSVSPNGKKAGQVNLADTVDEFSDLMETGRFKNTNDMLKALESDKSETPVKDKTDDTTSTPSADNIHKSDWIEIKKGSSTVLAKLTWKSQDQSQFIFVDRDGNRVCEITSDDLNKQLKNGTITLISATPKSQKRAAYSVIQTIK